MGLTWRAGDVRVVPKEGIGRERATDEAAGDNVDHLHLDVKLFECTSERVSCVRRAGWVEAEERATDVLVGLDRAEITREEELGGRHLAGGAERESAGVGVRHHVEAVEGGRQKLRNSLSGKDDTHCRDRRRAMS